MNMFTVSYDLMKPGQDYTALLNRIRAFGGVRQLESYWSFRYQATAAQVRDDLRRYIDTNDRLLVVDVTNQQFAWHNLRADIKASLSIV